MKKSKYKKIRKSPTFLFEYFRAEGGKVNNVQHFEQMLNMWLAMVVGVNPIAGRQKIVKELDDKHR